VEVVEDFQGGQRGRSASRPTATEVFSGKKRGRPESISPARLLEFKENVASSITVTNGKTPQGLPASNLRELLVQCSERTKQDTTGKPLVDAAIMSASTVSKYKKKAGIATRKEQKDNAARRKARHDWYNAASTIAMLSRVIVPDPPPPRPLPLPGQTEIPYNQHALAHQHARSVQLGVYVCHN